MLHTNHPVFSEIDALVKSEPDPMMEYHKANKAHMCKMAAISYMKPGDTLHDVALSAKNRYLFAVKSMQIAMRF